MLSWQDVMIVQERNKDLLREAEEQRLIQQALDGQDGVTIWEKVKGVISKFTQTNSTTKERACATCPSTDVAI